MKLRNDWIFKTIPQPGHILQKIMSVSLVHRLAFLTGKKEATIYGYCRPVPTDEDCHQTGSPSCLNETVEWIVEIHKESPEKARKLAEYFREVIDTLENNRPRTNETDVIRATADAAQNCTAALVGILADGLDQSDIEEMEKALQNLEAAVFLGKEKIRSNRSKLTKAS